MALWRGRANRTTMAQKSLADRTGSAVATGQSIANSGVLHLHVSPEPPAVSPYLQQVAREIAPDGPLRDRETELADLADFCIRPDPASPYLWLRAPAWTGKSALLAWFVLHPPRGVRIVSFFVTARFASQDTREAFVDVVTEQLAELLNRPRPTVTDATAEAHMALLLDDAARWCGEAGERLVLIVDGLDEDRTGDGRSIAGLLPVHPPADTRIIVASRRNPPLPSDVAPGHPLRQKIIRKDLARSPHAEVVRADMERELDRLLNGEPVWLDLLSLVTAAGGGLSGGDLAELTDAFPRDIARSLLTVTGRTFTMRTTRWDQSIQVYLLGHEELQKNAERFLGERRLAADRERLHTWAVGYRNAGWPDSTPEYLLRGYFRMLQRTNDRDRILACALDSARHDRMRQASGADTAALTEIAEAQRLQLRDQDPNIAALTNLALHKHRLLERNTDVPHELPPLLARTGQRQRAEALLGCMDSQYRPLTAHAMVVALRDTDQVDHALRLARTQPAGADRARALLALADVVPDALDAVHDELPLIRAHETTVRIRTALACRRHDIDDALGLLELLLAVTDEEWQDELRGIVAAELASAGQTNRAENYARQISWPVHHVNALLAVARSSPERARTLVAEIHGKAAALEAPHSRAVALAELAGLATIDHTVIAADCAEAACDAAREVADHHDREWLLVQVLDSILRANLIDQARVIVRSLSIPDTRSAATVMLLDTLTSSDPSLVGSEDVTAVDPDEFAAIMARGHARTDTAAAVNWAHRITDPLDRAKALTTVAARLVKIGRTDTVAQLLMEAADLTVSVQDSPWSASVYTVLASVIPDGTVALEAAERTAHDINDLTDRACALAVIANGWLDLGLPDRARTLLLTAKDLADASDPTEHDFIVHKLVDTALTATWIKLAEQLTRSMSADIRQVHCFIALLRATGKRAFTDDATRLIASVSIDERPYLQAELAEALASLAPNDARLLVEDAERAALALNRVPRAHALVSVVRAWTMLGERNHAEKLTDAIGTPQERVKAAVLTRVLPALATHTLIDLANDPHVIQLHADLIVALEYGNTQQAEAIALSLAAESRTEALLHLALTLDDDQKGRQILAAALVHGHWVPALPALAKLTPDVLDNVTDHILTQR